MRAFAAIAPIGLGIVAAYVVVAVFGRPRTGFGIAAVWMLAVAVSVAVTTLLIRAARRLLPLSTLLAVSLAFPDRAPSRLGVALRAGSPRRLLEHDPEHAHVPEAVAARVLALAAGLTAHDRATRGHSERVRAYSELIAGELGLDEDARDRLRWAALLHDVGKVTVPASTLNASHPLTDDERELLRRHPEEGHALTAPLASFLGEWEDAVAQHHERFDGGGYPRGLQGDELSLAARIVSVADSFDAMTSERSYARPLPVVEARGQLVEKAGGQFDPEVVRAFLNVGIGRLRKVIGVAGVLATVPALVPISRLASRAPSAAAAVPVALVAAVALAAVGPATNDRPPAARRARVVAAPNQRPEQAPPATVDAPVVDAGDARNVAPGAPAAPRSQPGGTAPAQPPGAPPAKSPPSSPPPPSAPPPPLPCQVDVGVACAGVAASASPAPVVVAHAEIRPTATSITLNSSGGGTAASSIGQRYRRR